MTTSAAHATSDSAPATTSATAKVITRFAPSPTGFLHIGGARTALFNYLFAKHHGGTFLLRVEDTDLKRSTPEATQAILDGMDWLGLKADGEIVYQSKNAPAHIEAALTMIDSGHAYRCYLTPEQQDSLRQSAREAGHAFRSPYRDGKAAPTDTASFVVRFRVADGQTHINDHVQGEVKWENDQFDDLVLLRADGSPTYMLAVVVDDHNMGITHVIRGDDHLINAGRQSLIYRALGWDVPDFAHVPLIHGPDGKKLSKRHGALGVEAYSEMGYIPEGIKNYLLKLGWAQGDQEIFTKQEAIEAFTMSGLNKAPARLDFDKMAFINGHHMQMSAESQIMEWAKPFLDLENERDLPDETLARVSAAMPSLKPRAKTLAEFAQQAYYITRQRPLPITGKAKKSLKGDAIFYLRELQKMLQDVQSPDWTSSHLEKVLTVYATNKNLGFGKIGQPLRAALTGGAPSPDLAVVLHCLGKDETLGRLTDCLSAFE